MRLQRLTASLDSMTPAVIILAVEAEADASLAVDPGDDEDGGFDALD